MKSLKRKITTCHWRNDIDKRERNLSNVVCRLHCLPCLRVIELGKCEREGVYDRRIKCENGNKEYPKQIQ